MSISNTINLRKFIFSLLIFLVGQPAFSQTHTCTVSGIVLDSLTREPISGVYITNGSKGAQTDANGKFVIKNLPKGKHSLTAMYLMDYPKAVKEIFLESDIDSLIFLLRQKAFEIDEVVITGTRTEKRLSEAPVLTTLIREREIQKAGSTSMLESLQDNIPGIVITPNAMGNNLRIKGLNSRYVLFLVDGERLVSEGAGGNVNLDQIDVNNIKRIEMINGAASALYGSNAVGAVINIITKEPIHKIEAGANLIAESNNTWRMKADIGSNLKKFSTRAGVFRNSSDGFGEGGNGAYAARFEDHGANLKFGYKPSESSDINIIGRYFRHETFNPDKSMNVKHPLTQNMTLGANGGIVSSDKKNDLKLSVNFDKYFDYDVLEKLNNQEKLKNTASYLSGRVVNTYRPTEKWELVGGLEYNHEENYSTTTLGTDPTTKKMDDMNGFAQAQYKLFKGFDIIGGGRYTYNSQFGSAFNPKLSLMYDVSGFKFRGGIGTAYRAPSIKELYYNFDHQGMFWVYGNPDLNPEKGLYTSLSVECTQDAFNASVSGYYNNIDNKITQYDVITQQGANEKYYKNVSSATLRGVDFSLMYTFFRELVLRSSYSYCDAKDNSTGLQLSSNVKHSGTASLTWNGKIAKSPFSLQFAGRMNSPKLYQQMVTDASGNQQAKLTESEPYSIWKATLVKPFRLKKHTVELTLKVDNIFDFKEASFINPGRQYMVGLRYSFK